MRYHFYSPCLYVRPGDTRLSFLHAHKSNKMTRHEITRSHFYAQGHSEVTYLLIRSGAKLNGRDKKYGK